MKYCAAYYSDIGIQKETNQDSLLLVQRGQTQDDEAVLAVICDGVGGLKMGERSSAAVVTAFRDWFVERVEELYEQYQQCHANFRDIIRGITHGFKIYQPCLLQIWTDKIGKYTRTAFFNEFIDLIGGSARTELKIQLSASFICLSSEVMVQGYP